MGYTTRSKSRPAAAPAPAQPAAAKAKQAKQAKPEAAAAAPGTGTPAKPTPAIGKTGKPRGRPRKVKAPADAPPADAASAPDPAVAAAAGEGEDKAAAGGDDHSAAEKKDKETVEMEEEEEKKEEKEEKEDVVEMEKETEEKATTAKMFPDVAVLDEHGATVQSRAFVADASPAVVFLYPKANTPGCTKQACGFGDKYAELRAAGYAVFGLSYDSPKSQRNWKAKHGLAYPFLCDTVGGSLISKLGAGKPPKGIKRSHFVIAKGGAILDAQVAVSPADSVSKALAFALAHKENPLPPLDPSTSVTAKDDAGDNADDVAAAAGKDDSDAKMDDKDGDLKSATEGAAASAGAAPANGGGHAKPAAEKQTHSKGAGKKDHNDNHLPKAAGKDETAGGEAATAALKVGKPEEHREGNEAEQNGKADSAIKQGKADEQQGEKPDAVMADKPAESAPSSDIHKPELTPA